MDYKKISTKIRRKVLEIVYRAQTSHIGSNFSCIDILTVLHFEIMRPKDKFILSKGWAAASLYTILAQKGYFSEKELDNYCRQGSKLMGLVNHEVKGIEVSTGSMGHGLPIGIGMALAKKLNKKKGRVFILMSDGEMDCGTTWESALFAAHHHLDNVRVIVDYNKWQAFGRTNKVLNLEPLADKWRNFGWEVTEVDGHNFKELEERFKKKFLKPFVVIAHTKKGKGVSFMEDKLEWHYKNISNKEYEEATKELKTGIC